MEEFNTMMFGRQVRFINAKAHEEMPEYYPEVGTIGIIVPSTWNYSNIDFLVDWPEGSTDDIVPFAY